jgi:hypothetical protein
MERRADLEDLTRLSVSPKGGLRAFAQEERVYWI